MIEPLINSSGPFLITFREALVGYDGNPEWLRVFSYLGYWIIIGIYLIRVYSPSFINKRLKAKFSFNI